MSVYIRKQIRDVIKNKLLNISLVQGRVFYDHLYSIKEDKMPCIIVSTGNENIERIGLGNPTLNEHILTLTILGVIRPTSTYQDDLDSLAFEIHKELNSDLTLNGLVNSCKVVNINPEFDDESDFAVSYISFSLEIKFRAKENDLTKTV